MSNLNIKRTVENIRSGTSVYTPIAEVVVNAIQAIEARDINDGRVEIRAIREPQADLDNSVPDISGFTIVDNGIGFTGEHRVSFDTLYTVQKMPRVVKVLGDLSVSNTMKTLIS
jgi:nitrogen fixation/metabolism regulation signal transduction histidine kinase